MNTILRSAALATALAVVATAASAHSPQYCQRQAQRAVDEAANPGASAAVGCGAGALIGGILSNGKGGAMLGGCGAGAVAGVVLSDNQRRQIYDEAYANCMGAPAAYNPPPPPGPPPGPWSAHATTIGNPYANVRVAPSGPVAYQLPYGSQVDVQCGFPGNISWCQIEGSGNWIARSVLSFN